LESWIPFAKLQPNVGILDEGGIWDFGKSSIRANQTDPWYFDNDDQREATRLILLHNIFFFPPPSLKKFFYFFPTELLEDGHKSASLRKFSTK